MRIDYSRYRFSKKEIIMYALLGAVTGYAIMYLFYNAVIVSIIGVVAGVPVMLGIMRKRLAGKRQDALMVEFGDLLESMTGALAAGYSMENAVSEAYRDLKLLYSEERIILKELEDMRARIDVGVPLDELFHDLGVRSKVSDIVTFSQVYVTARKSGGNLIKVMKRTSSAIDEKVEIESEIKTLIAGKRLESLCMIVIPLMIIVYLRVFSPGFLDPLYGGLMGRLFMSGALIVYALAVWWSFRLMQIDV